MTHAIEFATAAIISSLRSAEIPPQVENNAPIVPGLYLSWDEVFGAISVQLTSDDACMLRLATRVTSAPDWYSLNLSLGRGTFEVGDVLGVIVDFSGAVDHTFNAFVRTRRENSLKDTPLQDSLVGSADRKIRTLMHTIDAHDDLIGPEGYHTLILPLPHRGCEISLNDLGVFLVPASRGVRSTPETLTSAAI